MYTIVTHKLKKNFKPFTVYSPKHNARYVLEVPSPSDFKVGDVINFFSRDGDAGI